MAQNEYAKLDWLIRELYIEKDRDASLDIAIKAANEFMRIVFPSNSVGKAWGESLLEGDDFLDETIPASSFPNQKVESWFEKHPYLSGERTAIRHFNDKSAPIESKFYWLNRNSAKSRVAAGVMLTPNWEDGDLTKFPDYKVGIDFFMTSEGEALMVVLSNEGNLRVLELSEKLSNTQIDILRDIDGAAGFDGIGDLEPQRTIHKTLWDAFALKEVNKRFYEGVAQHFQILLQHLHGEAGKSEEDAKLFANRLIGRLLFIWFLRKKGFVNENMGYFACEGIPATEYYEESLKPLFFNTLNKPADERTMIDGRIDEKTPFLNGGLFDARPNDWADETIDFPPDWFVSLYEHFEQFNFTTDESTPEYEQVAIDPEMLGRVFENLLASQLDETGKEARKASGSFYTPREIVAYMCKESLREYLYGALGGESTRDGVDRLLDMTDKDFEIKHSDAKKSLWGVERTAEMTNKAIESLKKLRVVDPACGSGAFPMGMLQLLTKVYTRLGSTLSPYDMKLQILGNSIYGIDIQPMAVEISRLRAWLSIVVDEKDPKNVRPLPNLDFKFVCANTLVPLIEDGPQTSLFDDFNNDSLEKLDSIMGEGYYTAPNPEDKKHLRKEYQYAVVQLEKTCSTQGSERLKQRMAWNPFDSNKSSGFFDSVTMFNMQDGFDIAIGNPPYVSTKGVQTKDKKVYEGIYGFSDDTYSLFTFRGMQLIKEGGTLNFIVPKTFWTTQTKRNMRDLLLRNTLCYIFDTANPFESAMVDTCIFQVKKTPYKNTDSVRFLDGRESLSNPKIMHIVQSDYIGAQNSVIFMPSEFNLQVFEKYGTRVRELYNRWWDKIKTSRDIEKNQAELMEYRNQLKPGDIALLGCLTEGGVGLQTGNNGKYIAVRQSSKWADNVIKSRPKKLATAIKSKNIPLSRLAPYSSESDLLACGNEREIARVFDELKDEYGRDIFGQGYLYRLISDEELANVDQLTEDEKQNGIEEGKPYYVPYDKGDKDGNRWFLDTPFAIAWTKENVGFLKTNSGKTGGGMPVVRNPQFYFKEGFCWTDINSTFLKARIKGRGVFDVVSMSLFSTCSLPDWYFVALINSAPVSLYVDSFINNTSHFQINDARQLPVPIPSKQQLTSIRNIANGAISAKRALFRGEVGIEECSLTLSKLQLANERIVSELYGLKQ